MRLPKSLILLLLGLASGANAEANPPPNVVFILADDLGWNDGSLYGSTFYETPSIDALAKRGVKFNQAYSASPLCSPSLANIPGRRSLARIGITEARCHLPETVRPKPNPRDGAKRNTPVRRPPQ